MTSLSYEIIFSDFLGYVTDYQIASMNMTDAYELMTEYLRKVVSQPYVRRLFSSIDNDSEINTVSFEMKDIIDEDADKDFVINILSKGMVVEWLKPQVRNKNLTLQLFSGKEQKFYSQAQHLGEMRALLEETELEIRKEIRDRGYINNSYLESE